MPIYEYSCPKCKFKFETLRPISKCDEDSDCPKCKTPSKRILSKFISRSKADWGFLDNVPSSGGGSSCSSCSSGNCSSCGG